MEAFTPEQLREVDWFAEPQSESHPIRVRVTPDVIYDLANGEPIATTKAGYHFCWIHNHVHIVPTGWCGKQEDYTPRVQDAIPLADDADGSLTLALLSMVTNRAHQEATQP